ncbi:CheR family methyltransferase [Luteimonas sp. M1R5S18]|uniref:Chemotaxis protein methyltransferase n=1 Tax=Luteimonas rhizosphaericola TaxID=3042024 RepID=A0ABT6JE26_9GAMM|nr:CheR family methyltransferase [Luteimonas rhizosphaericola]MDH5828932.1 CheR family methyltransferase [Luteimonas rhizosphaericola]
MAELLREPPSSATGERTFAFEDRDFRRVCRMIYERAGISLGDHKRDMVYSRLVRRLRARGIERFSDYLDLVDADAGDEPEQFVNALTTNLTSFFREAHHFPLLATQLRAAWQGGPPLLVWCCAASTGEEPYSLAITACEAFDTLTPPVRILATDIDTAVLQSAARGVYTLDRIDALEPARKRRFFQRGAGANAGLCRVRPELRALLEFRPLNLLDRDYGLKRGAYAAVFCRNVMIYFDKPTQYGVLQRIVPTLAEGGRLYTGHSESFNHAADLVSPCGRTVYRAAADGGAR